MAAKLSFAQCFSDAPSRNAENFCHFIYGQEWLGKANTLQRIISKEHAIQSKFSGGLANLLSKKIPLRQFLRV